MNNGLARFDEFWQFYPKKVDKGHAEKAWKKLDDKTKALIIEILPQYLFARQEKYIPYPATWLNGKHWLDSQPKHERPQWTELQWHRFWKSHEGANREETIRDLMRHGFSRKEAEAVC